MKLGKQPTIVKDHCLLNGRGASKDTSTAERLTRGKMLGLGMRESKRKTLPTAVFPTEVERSPRIDLRAAHGHPLPVLCTKLRKTVKFRSRGD